MSAAVRTPILAERFAHIRWQRLMPWAVAALLLLVYFPALGSGFLVWDDPWLVDQSVRLSRTSGHDIWAIFTDFRCLLGFRSAASICRFAT